MGSRPAIAGRPSSDFLSECRAETKWSAGQPDPDGTVRSNRGPVDLDSEGTTAHLL